MAERLVLVLGAAVVCDRGVAGELDAVLAERRAGHGCRVTHLVVSDPDQRTSVAVPADAVAGVDPLRAEVLVRRRPLRGLDAVPSPRGPAAGVQRLSRGTHVADEATGRALGRVEGVVLAPDGRLAELLVGTGHRPTRHRSLPWAQVRRLVDGLLLVRESAARTAPAAVW